MKYFFLSLIALASVSAFPLSAQRSEQTLNDGWYFTKGGVSPDSKWQPVRVPHDWAIYGPFDRNNDLQVVAIEQNGETEESEKTGRTGGLPFIGKGNYKRSFEISDTTDRKVTLLFDGAMSNARVKVNGKEVGFWPYGYNSFYVNLPSNVLKTGSNELEVSLENHERASRWYPGAGLYRNVHLIETNRIHIPVWGTCITTPEVNKEYATVDIEMEISGASKGQKVDVKTDIVNPRGEIIASHINPYYSNGQVFSQKFLIDSPELWSLQDPVLYTAKTTLIVDGKDVDMYDTRFGIRKLQYIPEKGFFLNGEETKFKGVCLHHDLGPLGAAVNRSAIRHQIELLKDMGVNAIRTSHNMPAPELVELCDEMGVMLMIEPFDDWSFRPKSPNGYGAVFNEWAEKDVTNMVRHFRNSPSVVMWSIGNEVPSQWGPDGVAELEMLQNLVKSLDSTRPVTCGMDQIGAVLNNGFAAALDIPGFNYKPQYYDEAFEKLPQRLVLGSETASTVSSRGVYHFPVEFKEHNQMTHPDNQSNSYDNEACYWSNTPELDFAMDEDRPWVIGQFVWTGFDYLGEPSPYDTDAWPNHSSMFGIIDLASLPKDRYYLYRSVWNGEDDTLHVLPHWNWEGREGERTPVYVYTDSPKAELFINGVSQGIKEKTKRDDSMSEAEKAVKLPERYRLMWNDVVYQPGELRVVSYNNDGTISGEKIVKTAGRPHHLVVTPSRESLEANGDDLIYFTINVADKDGNIVPTASNLLKFKVDGAGTFEATANGDPKSLRSFQKPEMDLFSGAATAIARSSKTPGNLRFTVTSKGLKPATVSIPVL